MFKSKFAPLAAACALASVPAAQAGVNQIPTAVGGGIGIATGQHGVLTNWGIALGWAAGSSPSSLDSIWDGSFAAEGTQWNHSSYWWDENDPQVVTGAWSILLVLDQVYTFERLVMQADDNDAYRVEYHDGTGFQTAWDVGAVGGWGLRTRDTGLLAAPITTGIFRLTSVSGDGFYAISEFQAFTAAVPEPQTYALMLAGLGVLGAVARRRRT